MHFDCSVFQLNKSQPNKTESEPKTLNPRRKKFLHGLLVYSARYVKWPREAQISITSEINNV
jgi:hypothetical protein